MDSPFLVTSARSRWHGEIGRMSDRMVREMGFLGGVDRGWHEAWIWGKPTVSGTHYGFATFRRFGRWELDWIWIEPQMRRRGLVRAAWPAWRERYGRFLVMHPSEAFRGLLRSLGYVPAERAGVWVPGPVHQRLAEDRHVHGDVR